MSINRVAVSGRDGKSGAGALGGCNSDVVVRGVDREDRFGEEGRGKGHFKPGH